MIPGGIICCTFYESEPFLKNQGPPLHSHYIMFAEIDESLSYDIFSGQLQDYVA
jgi:hypothetical protein